jgi:hypothetical protein
VFPYPCDTVGIFGGCPGVTAFLLCAVTASAGFFPVLVPRCQISSLYMNTFYGVLVAYFRYMLSFLCIQDSFASAIIPLKDDVSLQEKYVTFKGYVRLGRLLEDMDIFAGEYGMLTSVFVITLTFTE